MTENDLRQIKGKYAKIYFQILDKRKRVLVKTGVYCEEHHVVPVSLGGTNDAGNLVSITAREHFICHYLLTKMLKGRIGKYEKMLRAFIIMAATPNAAMPGRPTRYFNSRLYANSRHEFSKMMKSKQAGSGNSNYGNAWIYNKTTFEAKCIRREELSLYLKSGWGKGKSARKQLISERRKLEMANELKERTILEEIECHQLLNLLKTGTYTSISQLVWDGASTRSATTLCKLLGKYAPEEYREVKELMLIRQKLEGKPIKKGMEQVTRFKTMVKPHLVLEANRICKDIISGTCVSISQYAREVDTKRCNKALILFLKKSAEPALLLTMRGVLDERIVQYRKDNPIKHTAPAWNKGIKMTPRVIVTPRAIHMFIEVLLRTYSSYLPTSLSDTGTDLNN